MAQPMQLDLSNDQRDILLRGLRFVKNAIALEMYDPTEELVAKRNEQIQEVNLLSALISGQGSLQPASNG